MTREWDDPLLPSERSRLQAASPLLATAFEDALLGMALVSPEGRFVLANPALCRLLGRSEEELSTLSVTDVTYPGDVELSVTNHRRAVAGHLRGYQLQQRYVHRDGHIVWAVLTTSLLRDAEGTPLCFFSQFLDLTYRGDWRRPPETEPPLQFVAVCDADGRFTDVSPAAMHLVGVGPEDLRGRMALDVVHPDDAAPARVALGRLRAEPGATVPIGEIRIRDGQRGWRRIEVAATGLLHHPEGGIRISARLTEPPPIGDRSPSDDTAARLLRAETDERGRVARELHDGLGQILTSIALFAKTIENELPPVQRQKLTALRGLADEALATTRSLAWSLRPVEMHGAGLLDSLGQLVQGVRDRGGLRVDFLAQGLDLPLPPSLETTIYRFVQEALVNVMRHARANTAAVVLSRVGSHVVALVEDDGVGFDAASDTGPAGGMGLLHMQERARLVGGDVRIESAPGKGTCLRLEVTSSVADLAASVAPPRG